MVREISPLRDVRSFISLFRTLKAHRPHAVHLHSSKAGFLGRLACRILNIRHVIYSPRGFAFLREDVPPWKRKAYYIFEKLAAWFGGTITACSNDEYHYAKKLTKRSMMIPNGIDLRMISKVKRTSSRSSVLIGTNGRISSQKNPALFCDIAERSNRKDVSFLWIGDGELRDIISTCGRPVTITGWKSREQGLELVSGLDIYVQTSLWEGMPISVLEAMALGKPVVATDIVGNRDLVIHGKTGYLGSSADDIARYVNILIDDPDQRSEMGQAGKRLIEEHYDIRRLVKSFEALYLATTAS
jgi:glycosyltransferase involved in cell wall biosynthesis